MAIIIGSARIDERGKISGGASGDQKQIGTQDFRGEVSMQNFYNHSKGWFVLRPKSIELAEKIATNMILACNNKNLGYDQTGRLGVIGNGINSAVPTECDCSSLVRACIKEASGKDPGNFNTANEAEVLEKTGLFELRKTYVTGLTLYPGDVLVTKTKGHTAIVVSGATRNKVNITQSANPVSKPLKDVAMEVITGKWGVGQDRKDRLTHAGYIYADVQAEVNRLLGVK